jgi:hypothetical protein
MENYPEFPVANLNYAGGHAARQRWNLVAQTTILLDKIEPCCYCIVIVIIIYVHVITHKMILSNR